MLTALDYSQGCSVASWGTMILSHSVPNLVSSIVKLSKTKVADELKTEESGTNLSVMLAFQTVPKPVSFPTLDYEIQ